MSILEQYPWPSGLAPEWELDTDIGRVRLHVIGLAGMGLVGHGLARVSVLGNVRVNRVDYTLRGTVTLDTGVEVSLRRPSHKDPSEAARRHAAEVIERAVHAWADENPEALAEGIERWRDECAHTLAKQVDECRTALELVERNLRNCVNGFPFDTYPLAQTPKIREGNGR